MYEPVSHRPHEIEQACAVFASVVDARTAMYVSAPLTSGRQVNAIRLRFELPSTEPLPRHHLLEYVIAPNRERARAVVRRLRAEFSVPVIDPTALPDLEDWTQEDYYLLWGRVIERYAGTVVFLDDWEFSNGCVYEFLVAARCNARALDERLHPLTLPDGLDRIQKAIANQTLANGQVSVATLVVGELEQMAVPEGARHAIA
jgi:hypothetical protein